MKTKEHATPPVSKVASAGDDLNYAIHRYVRAYTALRGRQAAVDHFGVSRHTLWRFLKRGHSGRSLPKAVLDNVGDTVGDVAAATMRLIASAQARNVAVQKPAKSLAPGGKPAPAIRRLPRGLEDALLLLCTAPLATVKELARLGRVPASTLRDRLEKLVEMGMVDSVSHRLSALGPHPQRRYFPTEKGIDAAAMAEWGTGRFLSEYPVSRQWFRLLTERLDAVAVFYHVAALISDADHLSQPVRVDHYRQGPYDLLVTLSGGRSVGLVRQGSTLPSANLRYRLRTIENLPWFQRPAVTLVITCSDQANRHAVRTLGHPMEHRTMFVATERKLLAGDARAMVWQHCGNGMGDNPPVKVTPDVSLDNIIGWTERLVESDELYRRSSGPERASKPTPDPDALYPEHVRAAMPQSREQVKTALSCNSPALRRTLWTCCPPGHCAPRSSSWG